jgi:hypothetical protein
MNKKNRLQFIRNALKNDTPNIIEKIDVKSIRIMDNEVSFPPHVGRQFFSRKGWVAKLSLGLSSFVFVGLIAVALNLGMNSYDEATPRNTYRSQDEVYIFTVLSAAHVLNQKLTAEDHEPIGYVPLSSNQWLIEDRLTRLNQYVGVIDLFVGNLGDSEVGTIVSTDPDFDYITTYTATDINNKQVSYSIKYNETMDSTSKLLTGYIEVANKSFYFEGSDQQVNSNYYTNMTVYPSADEKNQFIEVTQNQGSSIQEFLYKYGNGTTIVLDAKISLLTEEELKRFAELQLMYQQTLDSTYTISKQIYLEISYIIQKLDGPLVGGDAILGSAAEQLSYAEVGTIVVRPSVDLISSEKIIEYRVNITNIGERSYVVASAQVDEDDE